MNKFQKVEPIEKDVVLEGFRSDDAEAICTGLVALALHEEDWRWVQDRCLEFLEDDRISVRGVAATCLGHIARIHRKLDKERVLAALELHQNDSAIGGRIADALDDIKMFLKE
jgi:hypothetical protein